MNQFARQLSRCTILFALALPALAGDPVAGRDKVERQCAECHRPSDWNGETAAALQALITDITSGKVTHSRRTIKLSAEDIADIVAFWKGAPKNPTH